MEQFSLMSVIFYKIMKARSGLHQSIILAMIYYLLPSVVYSNSIKINYILWVIYNRTPQKEKKSFNNTKYKVKIIGEYIKHLYRQ